MARSSLPKMTYQKPTVIVPAGGSSQRFKHAGIMLPKGLIRFSMPMAGRSEPKTMIEHILDHDWVNSYETVVATRACDGELFAKELPDAYTVCALPATQGQADTIRQCILAQGITGPVLVVNSDNQIQYPLHALCQNTGFAAATLVVAGEGDTAYSYVDEFPLYQRAEEKNPISAWALAGAFYFPDAEELVKAVDRQMEADLRHAGEFYLSGALGLIQMGLNKLAVAMPRTMLHGWGTPEELARDPRVQIENEKINKLLEPYR